MNLRLILVVAASCLLAACATKEPMKGIHSTVATGKRMTVRTTAYTHTEPGGVKNGIGGRLRFHSEVRSAAADWSWLPVGTRFRVVGQQQEYVIEDYGSALVGRQTIDMYMPNMKMVRAWGVKHVDIEILEWGSKSMSLKLLQDRQRKEHVRRMVAALREQGVTPLAALPAS
jgi:3D (Asp-Asp-Asp) domain-containing protein